MVGFDFSSSLISHRSSLPPPFLSSSAITRPSSRYFCSANEWVSCHLFHTSQCTNHRRRTRHPPTAPFDSCLRADSYITSHPACHFLLNIPDRFLLESLSTDSTSIASCQQEFYRSPPSHASVVDYQSKSGRATNQRGETSLKSLVHSCFGSASSLKDKPQTLRPSFVTPEADHLHEIFRLLPRTYGGPQVSSPV